ncbi:MAG: type IV pilus modification PilV family protein [Planctomycetota bacterium]|jgi:Tfp pilus assembly protein PilV
MKCRSKKILLSALRERKGFSLAEVVAALVILAFVGSSMLVVISRCMASAADSVLRTQAFEVARDNMEELLASNAAKEMTEYGISDKYPEIAWQTVVETFYEPVTSRMWVQAICSAEYINATDETQTVELTHWLTNLTKEQLLKIMEKKQEQKRRLVESGQIMEGAEVAAEYLGVDAETVEQWVANGMPVTEDGQFIKSHLDLYQDYDGAPPAAAKMAVTKAYKSLSGEGGGPGELVPGGSEGPTSPEGPEPTGPEGPTSPEFGVPFWIGPDGTSYTRPELHRMPLSEIIPIIFNGRPA